MASDKNGRPVASDDRMVVFLTADLFAANGFEKGTLLHPHFPNLNAAEARELLAVAIDRYVLPQLDQRVQVTVIPTTRNPVRVTRADGREVVWSTPEMGSGPGITPTQVEVSRKQIESLLPKGQQSSAEDPA